MNLFSGISPSLFTLPTFTSSTMSILTYLLILIPLILLCSPSCVALSVTTSRESITECVPRSKTKVVEIAAAFSHRLCKKYGSYSATTSAILSTIEDANVPIVDKTCLFLKVVSFDGYCDALDDPYADYDPLFSVSKPAMVEMLPAFTSFWKTQRTTVHRDLAVFFTSFPTFGRHGWSTTGSICVPDIAYFWVENLDEIAIAHHIGHIFDAGHSGVGIMRHPLFRRRSPRPTEFDQISADRINHYASLPSLTCLAPSSPTPVPSPSSGIVEPPKRTCGALLAANTGFACKRRRLFPDTVYANGLRVHKFINMRYGMLQVAMKLEGEVGAKFRFRSVLVGLLRGKRQASRLPLSTLQQYGKLIAVGAKTRWIRRQFNLSNVEAAPRWKSCCNNIISVFIYAKLEQVEQDEGVQEKWSATLNVKHEWQIRCLTCFGTFGDLLPMSEERDCSVCRYRNNEI